MLTKKPLYVQPQLLYLIIMLIQLSVLLIVLVPVFDSTVFLLYLITTFSMLLRWRISLKPVFMLFDASVFILISLFYPPAAMYLFIFAYYFSYKNKLIYIIPLVATGLIVNLDSNYYILLLQAILFGTILHHWEKDITSNKELIDSLRQRIYNLELIQSQLLTDYQDTERLSRLAERQRIAEILHDSLGHELTAAHLSLKAYKALLGTNRIDQANMTLSKAEQRLENALHQLKDSVKYIEPNLEIGLNNVVQLCDNFIYPVNFTHSGDVLSLKPYIWQLVIMSVKEGLTNITKHAQPKVVNMSLEVTDYIVRLVIENDGLIDDNTTVKGNGLRYMRNRLEAVNGSLSIQKSNTFKLIIIIPIVDGR